MICRGNTRQVALARKKGSGQRCSCQRLRGKTWPWVVLLLAAAVGHPSWSCLFCFHGYHVSLWHHACSSDHFLPAAAAASQHSLTPSQQINGGSDMMTTHVLLLVVAGRADNIAAGHMTPTLPPSMGPVHVHPPFRLVGDQQLWKVVLKQSRLRVGLSLLPSVLCSY